MSVQIQRRPVIPNAIPRDIDHDRVQRILTREHGIKVRLGDTDASTLTDISSSAKALNEMPSSLSDVNKTLTEMQDLGIISLKQMQDIADRGRIDFTEALATISNIIINKAQSPAEAQKDIDGEEKKHEDVKPNRFPPGRHESLLKSRRRYIITCR
jgi:hypothetical protein